MRNIFLSMNGKHTAVREFWLSDSMDTCSRFLEKPLYHCTKERVSALPLVQWHRAAQSTQTGGAWPASSSQHICLALLIQTVVLSGLSLRRKRKPTERDRKANRQVCCRVLPVIRLRNVCEHRNRTPGQSCVKRSCWKRQMRGAAMPSCGRTPSQHLPAVLQSALITFYGKEMNGRPTVGALSIVGPDTTQHPASTGYLLLWQKE